MFYPPDELHQRWCDVLNLRFVAAVAYGPGSPSTYLTEPNRTVNVPGDGNCLLSALSYIVTGSKRQHAHYVTQYWKTSLIVALLTLRYGRVKSPQVYLAKMTFCFHDSMDNYLSFDTKIGLRNHSIAKLEAFFAVRCLYTEIK